MEDSTLAAQETLKKPEFMLPGDIERWIDPKSRLVKEISRKYEGELTDKEAQFVETVADESLRLLAELAKGQHFDGLNEQIQARVKDVLISLGGNISRLPTYVKSEDPSAEDLSAVFERYQRAVHEFNTTPQLGNEDRKIHRPNLEDAASKALDLLFYATSQQGVSSKGYIGERLARIDAAYERASKSTQDTGRVALAGFDSSR